MQTSVRPTVCSLY